MSFEQAMSDKNVDHRTDIWAIGVMIFEALTGRRPMTYETLGQMYAIFLQGSVPSVREYLPDMPDDAAQVIDHCLAKQPADRLDKLGPLIDVLVKYSNPDVPGAKVGGTRARGTSGCGARRHGGAAVLLGQQTPAADVVRECLSSLRRC